MKVKHLTRHEYLLFLAVNIFWIFDVYLGDMTLTKQNIILIITQNIFCHLLSWGQEELNFLKNKYLNEKIQKLTEEK